MFTNTDLSKILEYGLHEIFIPMKGIIHDVTVEDINNYIECIKKERFLDFNNNNFSFHLRHRVYKP